MTPTEVVIPDYVPPKELTLADVVKAASGRAEISTADLIARLQTADVVAGRAQVRKSDLIATPFLITSVTYRESTKGLNRITGETGDYVCVDFVTVPSDGSDPIEAMFIDGSTGVRRQITGYLAKLGVLAEGYKEEPDLPVWVSTV